MILVLWAKRLRLALIAAGAALPFLHLASSLADPIRIVTYNIEADTGGYTTPRPGLITVLQGIGDENVNGLARPLDVLSLQETTSNTTTVAPIVTALNNLYGAGIFAMSPYQATQNGSAGSGNGPNALVYNTTTLQLVTSVGIGTPSTSGAPRQPVRYQLRPMGGSASNDFYVYVSHYKAGTTSSDLNRRNIEAQLIRTNEATMLPADARVMYTGDFNVSSSAEASFQTITAPGPGQGFDCLNMPGTWALNPAFQGILTESAPNLRYRDDFEVVTQNILGDFSGIYYIAGSYHTFGNNGTTPINGTVNSPSNTALPGLPNRAAVLSALTTASDHLPVVADYNVVVNHAPAMTGQPSDQIVCSGGHASFAVTASGTPPPTYRWRRGTTNLSDGANISGALTATLTIDPVGGGDAGADYNCVVTNAVGSVTSNQAALTVRFGPGITTQPQDQSLCTGAAASFSIAASGTPAPTYQWTRNAGVLSDGAHVTGATTATLSVSDVTAADAGSYACIVSNACDSATSGVATLSVDVGGACCRSGACVLLVGTCACEPFVCNLFDYVPSGAAGCFGDADANDVVNPGDRGVISANIGQTDSALICRYDLDGNGVINPGDRGVVSANIGLCTPLPDYQNGSGLNHGVPDTRFGVATFMGAGTSCEAVVCP